MRSNIRKALVVGGVVAGFALGGTGIAAASATTATPDPATAVEEQDPRFTGTVSAPPEAAEGQETEGTETEATQSAAEADESKALEVLATVTPEQATAEALKAVPGTVGSIELHNENGFVVYSVEVAQADGTTVDVVVDAGDASILAQDTDTETNDD